MACSFRGPGIIGYPYEKSEVISLPHTIHKISPRRIKDVSVKGNI